MTSAEIDTEASVKEEVKKILQKQTLMKFNTDSDCWIASVHNQTARYVIATIRRKSLQNVVSSKGNQDHPTVWLINLEERKAEYLLLDLSDYDDPEIVKVSSQFNSDGNLTKVNFIISDRRYNLKDSELLFGLHKEIPEDKKEHDVVEILKLLKGLYDLRSVNVKSKVKS